MDTAGPGAGLEAGDLASLCRGGWLMALLVARNVQLDPPPADTRGPRSARTSCHRISARELARRTHISHDRIMAYLRAWERAAQAGLVPAAGMTRGRDVALPDEQSVPFYGPDGYFRPQDGLHHLRAPAHPWRAVAT